MKEVWKDVVDYEGIYLVSNYGRVKSIKNVYHKGIILKQEKSNNGYLRVHLCKNNKSKHYSVHRLVIKSFYDEDLVKKYTNHKDGNKLNNHIFNLEWCTLSENMKHAYRLGLYSLKGESHTRSKLNNLKVRIIRGLRNEILNGTMDKKYLADIFNVSVTCIRDVLNYRRWKHI